MFGFKIKLLKKNLLAGKHYANRGNTVCHKRFFSELLHVKTHKCTINLELFVLYNTRIYLIPASTEALTVAEKFPDFKNIEYTFYIIYSFLMSYSEENYSPNLLCSCMALSCPL